MTGRITTLLARHADQVRNFRKYILLAQPGSEMSMSREGVWI